MCLIRVRREAEDDEVVHPRLSSAHAVRDTTTTTTVITPIPPPPPPPPAHSVYSDALVTTNNHHGGNYVYDVGTGDLVEAEYRNADGYTYDADRHHHGHRDYRSSDSEYLYSAHHDGGASSYGGSRYDYDDHRDGRVTTTKTTIIKGNVARSQSDAGRSRSRSRSHSRSRSYVGVVRAASTSKTSKPDFVTGPGGEAYVKTHRHRHRRRSGSLEREKSVTRFSHVESPEGRRAISGTGRHSHVSISNGRSVSDAGMSEQRSSFRYIEPRGSAVRGLESADMVRRREEERFAYGGLNQHRRSGSVSYVAADSGHRRSFSGDNRRSREKIVVMDSRDYY